MVEMHWIDVCECEFKMVDVCVGAWLWWEERILREAAMHVPSSPLISLFRVGGDLTSTNLPTFYKPSRCFLLGNLRVKFRNLEVKIMYITLIYIYKTIKLCWIDCTLSYFHLLLTTLINTLPPYPHLGLIVVSSSRLLSFHNAQYINHVVIRSPQRCHHDNLRTWSARGNGHHWPVRTVLLRSTEWQDYDKQKQG